VKFKEEKEIIKNIKIILKMILSWKIFFMLYKAVNQDDLVPENMIL